MILRHLSITASPDERPGTSNTYGWSEGHPIEHLEAAVAKLQETVLEMRRRAANPLAASLPIVTDSPDFVFVTPTQLNGKTLNQ